MESISVGLAFLAGLASFFSPCCLPLVPSYLMQLVGPSLVEDTTVPGIVQGGSGAGVLALPSLRRQAPFWHAVAFVAGFSLIFISLGASASVLGGFLKGNQLILARVGGLLLIGLGLHYTGFLRIPFLHREGRLQWRPTQRGYPASFAVGVIYAFGWTPCIGVVLTGILILAAQSGTLASGVLLLSVYSLGLGLPFLGLGAAFTRIAPWLKRFTPHLGTIERVTGIVMVVMGIMIFNEWLLYLNAYFYRIGVRGI